MKIELTEAERELTLHALRNRLGDLQQEIHHSSVSQFTEKLKEMEALLQGIIDKLDVVHAAKP